jgi:WD40 repeat protein
MKSCRFHLKSFSLLEFFEVVSHHLSLSSLFGIQINSLMASGPDDKYFATCSDDGSLRVWTADELEQTLQFQVMDQVLKTSS